MNNKIFPIVDGKINMPATELVAMPENLREPILYKATIEARKHMDNAHPFFNGWYAEIYINAYGLPDITQLRNAMFEIYNLWPELFDIANPINVRSGMSASFLSHDHQGYLLRHICDEHFYHDYMTARIFHPGTFIVPDFNTTFGRILQAVPFNFLDGRMELRVLVGNYRTAISKCQLINKIRTMFIPISQTLRFGNVSQARLIECSAKAEKLVRHPVYGMVPEKTAFINLQHWNGEPLTILDAEWTSL